MKQKQEFHYPGPYHFQSSSIGMPRSLATSLNCLIFWTATSVALALLNLDSSHTISMSLPFHLNGPHSTPKFRSCGKDHILL